MSKFRNDSGGVLTVNDLMITVGPGEKFDWPGHDIEVHGLPTGCTWLNAPDAPKHQDHSAVHDPEDPAPADPDAATAVAADEASAAADDSDGKNGKRAKSAAGQDKENSK